jgi:hypothetical protein
MCPLDKRYVQHLIHLDSVKGGAVKPKKEALKQYGSTEH